MCILQDFLKQGGINGQAFVNGNRREVSISKMSRFSGDLYYIGPIITNTFVCLYKSAKRVDLVLSALITKGKKYFLNLLKNKIKGIKGNFGSAR